MFKKTFIAALGAGLTVIGAGASAQEATPAPEFDRFASTVSRAHVAQQTEQAAQAGLIARNDADLQRLAAMSGPGVKSRAQVNAETQTAKSLGLVVYGETDVPSATMRQIEQIRIAGERALRSDPVVAGR